MAESDIVELIIAVDLDPTDPEQPLNVNDVKIAGEEEAADSYWRDLVARLVEASGGPGDEMSDDELREAAEQVLSGGEMAEDVEEDMFSRAMSMPRSPGMEEDMMGGPFMGPDEEEEF